MKKLASFLIFIFLSSCGFNPVYLSNEYSIIKSIKKIELKGNQDIGKKIINNLNIETNSNNNFSIILESSSEKVSISKNSSNITTGFMMILDAQISVIDNNQVSFNKSLNKKFTYNNKDNKFELLKYERSIEENLINEISEEILLILNLENDNQRISNQ